MNIAALGSLIFRAFLFGVAVTLLMLHEPSVTLVLVTILAPLSN